MEWVENNVRKGENAAYQHFSFSFSDFNSVYPQALDCLM